jgi:hypothetical protein
MINVDPLRENNILYLSVLADEIDFNPEYQREGDIWPLSKKQLFIDSLINGIDIPKMYFHEVKKNRTYPYRFAVVDGKQRLETLLAFLRDDFSISDEFVDLSGEGLSLAGRKYSEFSSIGIKFKTSFDAKQLPIYVIRTDDPELIDEMFFRLNEAAPLNAAEKRNSYRGPYPKMVRELISHPFFQNNIPFTSRRYKHHDIAGKIMMLAHCKKVVDTKKIHLDKFAKELPNIESLDLTNIESLSLEFLNHFNKIFTGKESVLKSPSFIPVLFVVWRSMKDSASIDRITKDSLYLFDDLRIRNRMIARENEEDSSVNHLWLEYDRLIQSPNDSSSIDFRAKILLEFLMG